MTIQPYGDPKTAKLILLGGMPDQQDLRHGRPFMGQVGDILDDCLQAARITPSECYYTTVFKDLATAKRCFKMTKKGPVINDEGHEWIKALADELCEANAEVIIAFGPEAMFATVDRIGIQKWRGSILHSHICDKTVIPTFHPDTLLWKNGGQFLNKHCIIFDLKKAVKIIRGEYQPTKRELIIKPDYFDVLAFLEECRDLGLRDTLIAYDIEISNMEVSCISFSHDLKSMCIPFIKGGGDYFSPDQEATIWLEIAKLLEDRRIQKVGQNLVFDTHFLLRKFGIHARNLHDTMVAQRILMPDYKIGLDFITSIWTDLPYYKDDGKFWLNGAGDWERGWEYNAIDSVICDEAFPKQVEALKAQGNWETYLRTRKIIPPLVFMMERGIKIDVDQMKADYDATLLEIARLELELNDMAGQALNAKSPKQLCEYFYSHKGLKPYMHKGRPTTNELALKRISRLGHKEATQILKIRGLVKENSTYRDTSKIDLDGRLRCSYNPVGTRYSRISSSRNIFGTGNNLQNQPHGILKYFLADDDCVMYEIDLSQAENRIVAYVGRIEPMIEAFETGKDVHSLTGALISGKTPEEVKEEDKAEINCPLGSGDKTWRFWGKKANHGLNYDLGYKQFSLYYEIPEQAGKLIVDRYHAAYPGVRKNFHAYVKRNLTSNRTLTNLMGRKTLFMGNLGDYRERDKIFKEAYACIPQGTVGDVINERGMNFVYYEDGFDELELLMQVHDSIKFQIPMRIGWKRHAEMLIRIKRSLETPLVTHYGREFSIPADVCIGLNMDKHFMTELKGPEFSEDVDVLAEKLEEIVNEKQEMLRSKNEHSNEA
jgi:DNA polymerase-1